MGKGRKKRRERALSGVKVDYWGNVRWRSVNFNRNMKDRIGS